MLMHDATTREVSQMKMNQLVLIEEPLKDLK